MYFTEVMTKEYTNGFDFYVSYLQFQYLTEKETHTKKCLNELDTIGII